MLALNTSKVLRIGLPGIFRQAKGRSMGLRRSEEAALLRDGEEVATHYAIWPGGVSEPVSLFEGARSRWGPVEGAMVRSLVPRLRRVTLR